MSPHVEVQVVDAVTMVRGIATIMLPTYGMRLKKYFSPKYRKMNSAEARFLFELRSVPLDNASVTPRPSIVIPMYIKTTAGNRIIVNDTRNPSSTAAVRFPRFMRQNLSELVSPKSSLVYLDRIMRIEAKVSNPEATAFSNHSSREISQKMRSPRS